VPWRRKRARLVLMATVAVVAATAGVVAHQENLLRWVELQSIDARFEVRGTQPAPKGVAVVAIDDRTFSERPDDRWPFLRRRHAKAIEILHEAGAKVIVYDVQFTEPSNPEDDGLLFNSVYRAGNVVLGTSEIAKGGKTRILGSDKNTRAARARPASAQYDLDPNGVIRRIPFQTDDLKTMPVVAYERAYGHPPDRAGFKPDGAWINFAGPPRTLRTLSFSQLLAHHFPPDYFRGRIVVVGASAPSIQDVHPTSTSGNDEMSGPEVQASAIATLQEGIPLRSVPNWVDLALIVLLALLAPLAGLRLGLFWSTAVAVLGIAAFLVGAQIAFQDGHLIAITYPVFAAVLSTIGVVALRYLTEVRERRRTRTAFARFVPAAVVDRVLEQAEDGLRLGGEEVLGTVLFSDIRGFTTFSESHPAGEVIDILNRYLTEMTDAIMGHGGTLIGYLGDGIIAIFGAPLEQDDHADRALAAAMEMLGPRMASFNEWLRERGIDQPFETGIGMNSGLFMAGNVGSQDRLEYTVIGDTVNTAARMEGLTKGTGHSLFIAESTHFMLLGDPPDLQYVGEFEIRGRAGRMKIWAPGLPEEPGDRRIDDAAANQGVTQHGRKAPGRDRTVRDPLEGSAGGGRQAGR
jgi:adenylate cyclase